jgi:hypothetical protein
MPAGKDVAIAVSAKIRPKLSKMILSGLEWGADNAFHHDRLSVLLPFRGVAWPSLAPRSAHVTLFFGHLQGRTFFEILEKDGDIEEWRDKSI